MTVLKLASPDGRQGVTFAYEQGELHYSVSYRGQEVIRESRAGLDVDNWSWEMALGFRNIGQRDCWMDNFETDSVTLFSTVDSVWSPVYGERSVVRDCYNSGTLHLSKKDGSRYRLDIQVRAYDEGIAFRYYFPEHPGAIFHKVTTDLTEYTFPEGTMAWAEEWAQGPFRHVGIDELTRPVERALTLESPNGIWTALADADVDDWCLTRFQSTGEGASRLKSVMYSPVDIVTYYATPWKVIINADTPGGLLEQNDIILNLNPPCEIEDTSWIKPGKIMREATLQTDETLKHIDFCADHNIPYMLFDWKWYEPCTSHDGDATVVVDRLDMPKVIAYGKEKGVGVWLYVNQHALMKQARELFPLLKHWGVVGVKSGFVQYASHRWATWLHDLVRLAADNGLMMNIHDEFRPSGFSRTYPNLVTQEGIHGNEEWPDATHNVTLPFTRMINGAADYTICYYDRRLKNTHAHQLAASLVMYSPMQTILWYDSYKDYCGEPEMEWFEHLETTFDDSRVLGGYPGRDVTIARRKGDEWYVGMMTNNDARSETLSLSFLDGDRKYLAYIYTDGAADTRTGVLCSRFVVTSSQTMHFDFKERGGAALRFVPLNETVGAGLAPALDVGAGRVPARDVGAGLVPARNEYQEYKGQTL